MEGFLEKKIHHFGVAFWRRKWVSLNRRGLFIYSQNKTLLQEFFPLATLELLSDSESCFDFTLFLSAKKATFRADSLATKQLWISALRTTKYSSEAEKSRRAPPPVQTRRDSLVRLSQSMMNDRRLAQLRDAQEAFAKQLAARVVRGFRAQARKIDELQRQLRQLEGGLLRVSTAVGAAERSFSDSESASAESSSSRSFRSLTEKSFTSAREKPLSPAKSLASCRSESSRTVSLRRSRAVEPDALQKKPTAETLAQEVAEPLRPELEAYLRASAVFAAFPVSRETPATRSALPALQDPARKVNLLAVLRSLAGKDLVNVSFPCAMNEPLSQVQRSLEFVSRLEPLRRAAQSADECERALGVISPFYLSLCDTSTRKLKPFSPFVGETFELIVGDVRALSEHVSRQPLITAYHVDSPAFTLEATYQPNVRFSLLRGVSIEVECEARVLLKATGEEFTVESPQPCLRSLLSGDTSLYFEGHYRAVNRKTGARATIAFVGGRDDPARELTVRGTVEDAAGEPRWRVEGGLGEELRMVSADGSREKVLAGPCTAFPANRHEQFNFNDFTIGMNHLSWERLTRLPLSDSRLRPDVRAYEHGDAELAERERLRLDKKQHARRKQLEAQGKKHQPVWFAYDAQAFPKYQFTGKYWQCAESGQWPAEVPDLYS